MDQHRGTDPHPVDALIVVDVQAAFVGGDGAVPGAARLVDRTADLIARARQGGALVVHLQNDGPPGAEDEPHTPGWELHHPVRHAPTEMVIRKPYDDGFRETPLGDVLADAGVRAVAVCGVMSEMCVQATARTALDRGYRVVVPHDAHATQDVPAAPGICGVVPAATVSRVAAYALGSDAEVTSAAADVTFTAPAPATDVTLTAPAPAADVSSTAPAPADGVTLTAPAPAADVSSTAPDPATDVTLTAPRAAGNIDRPHYAAPPVRYSARVIR